MTFSWIEMVISATAVALECTKVSLFYSFEASQLIPPDSRRCSFVFIADNYSARSNTGANYTE